MEQNGFPLNNTFQIGTASYHILVYLSLDLKVTLRTFIIKAAEI